MLNNEDFLKDSIESLESTFGEINTLKNSLLGASLEQFRYIFNLNSEETPILKSLPKEEVLRVKQTLEDELLPLFKESDYGDGIKQIEEWKKLLQENLEG